jgi:stage II sporulation SpoAA-like protein
MRLLFVIRDFQGWRPDAAWEDFRVDREHGEQVERIAMVGEKKWQK